jgi:hypothetical protein
MLQVRVLSLRPKAKEGNASFPLLLLVEVAEKRSCFELAGRVKGLRQAKRTLDKMTCRKAASHRKVQNPAA